MLDYHKRDGFLYNFSSLILLDGADVWNGLMSVSVKATVEGGDAVYGQGPIAYGYTRGQLKCECEFSFAAEAFFDLRQKYPRILTTIFDDLLLAFEEGSRRDTIVIVSPRITSVEIEAEGTDATEIVIPGLAINVLMGPNREPLFEGSAQGASRPQL